MGTWQALKLEWVPDWIAIVGSGYIGLEFSDVYTALGSEVAHTATCSSHTEQVHRSDVLWSCRKSAHARASARQVTFIEALPRMMPGFDRQV